MNTIQSTDDYRWAKVVAQAWADDGFRARLLDDPETVLNGFGFTPPANGRIEVTESDGAAGLFVLPPKPADIDGNVQDVTTRLRADWCMLTSGSV